MAAGTDLLHVLMPTKEGEADGAGRARSFVAAATLALIFGVF